MSEIKNGNSPFLFEEPPPVSHRIGTDLHINNVSNQDDYIWLMALIWPEHNDRRTMLRKVAQVVNNNNLKLRSEEHTSELQSRGHLVCRLLLEKKKKTQKQK